ncbi:acireductone synthase [Pseudoalteromonas tunicata]|uniref:Enolase-phosphatase E1 n=1 Tax=Pseudoalteromonas tunicata D2 TaxID=87626 RepID=A4CFA9_9GAMM|nr:acireductone synthase [Pseudoalteromonas tunicata]ATC92956.1 enolase-phosphatase E1 [Pseudoalteromonas tunicata]AXT32055.1 acireductone synthase [Pseudoalteromonas tunicata]EAR26547.1 HAD-superfamily hydrolase [Pseudoalteromonas tunicata D2]
MIKAILTDIEGTITRISFVKEVLFPYAASHIAEFVQDNHAAPEVATQIAAVKAEINQPDASLLDVIATLQHWIATDQKITPLKQLQGMIWQQGYHNRDFTGHLYPDAYQFLQQQFEQGIVLYVYSSGSVKAQHLLFEFSDYGDIRSLFNNYFDTLVGGKKEPQSYHNIVDQLPFSAHEVLFLSDVIEELDAAKSAGLKTCHLVRDGQATSSQHAFIHDFNTFEMEQYT